VSGADALSIKQGLRLAAPIRTAKGADTLNFCRLKEDFTATRITSRQSEWSYARKLVTA